MSERWIVPGWPAPPGVRSLLTTRYGGVSQGVYASLNLGDHVGDDAAAVAENRARVVARLPGAPKWLNQVHGVQVLDAAAIDCGQPPPAADAAFARNAGIVCAVMTADCLPALFCDTAGTVVAAVHAGWRGLLAGVLERTVAAMCCPGERLIAYFGPAIGPQAFLVGSEVREAFVAEHHEAATAFRPVGGGDGRGSPKWLADLAGLARQRLARIGVTAVYGGDRCTFGDAERFFSYRRDGATGRMAALIWLD
ncbi:MAG: peptidoglycan editing factor PgeF [Betaproteobacteria bacterium]|nr:peptidoglycan editing factor PgeF [Betaproteobacteria bacterium]